MRRINYMEEEYLIHTRSGMTVYHALVESGIPVQCNIKGDKTEAGCRVKWPKDTAFLLTNPTELERQVLGADIDKGWRLITEAMFK